MSIAKSIQKDPKNRDPLFVIIFSVVIASILVVYPLSYNVAGWRPAFMLLVTLFWVLCQPQWCGMWFAFTMGIFTDLLLGAPLGINALSFVTISFFARYFIRERRVLTFTNLWIIVSLALFTHLIFMFFAQIMAGIHFSFTRHWQTLGTSIFFWPIQYYLLKKWRI